MINSILNGSTIQDSTLKNIAGKVLNGERISPEDAVALYKRADLGFLGLLASVANERVNGKNVFFNRNFHIEPTNICIHSCTFCSYRREVGQEGSWVYTTDDIRRMCSRYKGSAVTEVHITGGVHPDWGIYELCEIIKAIKQELPTIHVKAFSAVEVDYAAKKANLTYQEALNTLKAHGLDSIPGGGAEIAEPSIRKSICASKTTWDEWLQIHEAAHGIGLTSNATMLYGHVELYEHRVNHMSDLRDLQDRTGGFNCFIPLKFKSSNNKLGHIGEVSGVEDLRNFAVARIFMDNFSNLKAYWPMLGKEQACMALDFGANDLDGTIDETTKIYSMAGADEQSPSMTIDEIVGLVRSKGKTPVERDSLYRAIKTFD